MLCPLVRGSLKVGRTFEHYSISHSNSLKTCQLLSFRTRHLSTRVPSQPHYVAHRSSLIPFDGVLSFQLKAQPTSPFSTLTKNFRSQKGLPSIMGWLCPTCTFANKSGVHVCEVCSSEAPSSTSNAETWSCEACTFLNPGESFFCEICGTGQPESKRSSSNPITSGNSGAAFRPLRAQVKPEQESVERSSTETPAITKNAKLEREEVEGSNSEIAPLASGIPVPKPRKRKARDDEVVNLSDFDAGCEVPGVKVEGKESVNGSNNLLKTLHQERMSRRNDGASASDVKKGKGVASTSVLSIEQKMKAVEREGTWLEKDTSELLLLYYNVWFRDDLEAQGRMDAIGDIILERRPHIICFQEVTENIYNIFRQASWWRSYECSVKPGAASKRAYFCMQLSKLAVVSFDRNPFRNSMMGRELCLAKLKASSGAQLMVATTHLESPCPAPPTWNQMFSTERVVQAKEAMAVLKDVPNAIFGGDMNWDDKLDGPPPLPSGWFDAWLHLHPGKVGFTYDSKANPMLTGSRLQKRLDRIYCQLQDFEVVSLEMVGTAPIPDLTYQKERKVKGRVQMMTLPVLPSDHFGLLLKVYLKHSRVQAVEPIICDDLSGIWRTSFRLHRRLSLLHLISQNILMSLANSVQSVSSVAAFW